MRKEEIGKGIVRYCYDTNEEWLHARTLIGGSDASAIIGLSPYKTNQQLWKEKTGLLEPEDISNKPYVKYGHDAEPIIRNLFALEHPDYEVEYHENNLIVNDAYPWAHASLDGELTDPFGRKGVWEAKTTTVVSSYSLEKWKDRIPDQYYIQCLHYLMVTGYEFVCLTALMRYEYPDKGKIEIRQYHFERSDAENDIAYLVEAERQFSIAIAENREPALLLPEI